MVLQTVHRFSTHESQSIRRDFNRIVRDLPPDLRSIDHSQMSTAARGALVRINKGAFCEIDVQCHGFGLNEVAAHSRDHPAHGYTRLSFGPKLPGEAT